MAPQIAFLLVLLAVMVYLFMTERLPVDLTAFLGLLVLLLAGYLAPDEAFSGFASPAVITMLAIFIVSGGLRHTGLAEVMGKGIYRLTGPSEARLVLLIMLVAGGLSAFMNNIAATAVLLPAVAAAARRSGISPSRLLMPLSFGAILGGTSTLVGTPPNILAAEVLRDRGLAPFRLFDFTPLGLLLLGVGVAYMLAVGRRLLPERSPMEPGGTLTGELAQVYRLEERLFSLRIPPRSPLDGSTLRRAGIGAALNVQVVAILRDGRQQLAPEPDEPLRGGDVLLVEGRQEDVRELLRVQGVRLEEAPERLQAQSQEVGMVGARLAQGSPLVGQTLRQIRFRERYGLVTVAIRRQGQVLGDRLGELPLQPNDELLLLGPQSRIQRLQTDPDLHVGEGQPSGFLQLDEDLFLIHVPAASSLVGQTLGRTRLGELVGLTVAGIVRGGQTLMAPGAEAVIEADDGLLVAGDAARLLQLMELGQLQVAPLAGRAVLESEDIGVAEAAIAPRSEIAGKTPDALRFRDRYGLSILAVWREGRPIRSGIARLRLRFGDALLLQGPRAKIQLLGGDPDFLVLSEMAETPRRGQRAPLAVGALVLMIGAVVVGWLPIHVAAFAAAVLMVLTGCLTMEEAYRQIEWRAIFLVAAILPAGIAMERSGAARLIADGVVALAGPAGPYAVLAGLAVLSSLLSQGLDGAPTVVLLAPVALGAVERLGLSPYPAMMVVGLAASAAFMTPFSHKANLLVMGAGGYRPGDYVRVGTPLTVVILVLLVLVTPLLFPL